MMEIMQIIVESGLLEALMIAAGAPPIAFVAVKAIKKWREPNAENPKLEDKNTEDKNK